MDNKDLGWVSVYRSLLYSDLWLSEKFTRGQAWVDLIGIANWKTGTVRKRGILVTVGRGQVGWSIRRLAERWRWSPSTVKLFLNELKDEAQIDLQMGNVTTVITIINYEEYQQPQAQSEPQTEHRPTADQPQANTNNKDKQPNKEITTAAPADETGEAFPLIKMPELAVLRKVPGYPFDLKTDFDYLSEWSLEFPMVDVVELLKNWNLFITDRKKKTGVAFAKNASPRGQLRNQFKMAKAKGMHKKPEGNGSEPPGQSGPDALEYMKQEIKKQEELKS